MPAVIGHEITHGYDDQGRKFDADGNLKDWWTAADAANYEQRDKCITDEYTQDVPEAGVKQNGKLSASEDTADNGGVHIALAGFENTLKSQGKYLDHQAADGATALQNFFLAYANVCGEVRPEVARTAVMTQGHSLARYRVNNVLGNTNAGGSFQACLRHAHHPSPPATEVAATVNGPSGTSESVTLESASLKKETPFFPCTIITPRNDLNRRTQAHHRH